MPLKLGKDPARSLMAASGSFSSLLLSKPHSFLPPTSNYSIPRCHLLPSRTQTANFSLNSESKNKHSDSPVTEKKSFAVVTGEVLRGLASNIFKRKKGNEDLVSEPGTMLWDTEDLEGEAYGLRTKERIASVTEQSVDSGIVWEQSLKDVEAERDLKKITSPGFSFSAAGMLMPYHLGVAQFLIEKGYIKETTPLAGSSAGAIACAVIASGSSMQEALKVVKIIAEDCRLRGTVFRLGAVLRNILHDVLPDDVHSRSNGRVRVAVTQILWRPKGLLVDQFDSKEDLINAVITSSFIPGYLAPRPATLFRNRLCVDGALTLFMPPTSAPQTEASMSSLLGCTIQTEVSVQMIDKLVYFLLLMAMLKVRVCAFPANQLARQRIGISPHCNPENRPNTRQLFRWTLEPAEDYVLDKLFELGYLDASVWGEQNPMEEIVEDQSNHNRCPLTNG